MRLIGLWILVLAVWPLLQAGGAVATEAGRYQVVAGSDETAYLVDTATGAVWALTYRTLATGRVPVAIPYTFLRISPKNQGEFIVESATGASVPSREPGKR